MRDYESPLYDPEDAEDGLDEELGYLGLHLWTDDDFYQDVPDDA